MKIYDFIYLYNLDWINYITTRLHNEFKLKGNRRNVRSIYSIHNNRLLFFILFEYVIIQF